MELPRYRDLPVAPSAPPGSSWGVWGLHDELGALNLLDDARTRVAAACVRRGEVFPLQLPLDEPAPGVVWRTPPRHHVLRVGHETDGGCSVVDQPQHGYVDRDDYLDGFWLQGSTQWDGLAHIRHPEHGNYNGVPDADVHAGPGARLGVDRWAGRAVVGRAVLVDVATHFEAKGQPIDPRSCRQISSADLDDVLAAQGSPVDVGDVLLLHTGWLAHLLALPPDDRRPSLDPRTQQVPGLEVSEDILEWLWDHHVAAVAADNVGVEACGDGLRFELHRRLLPLLGIPLGEYWWLRDLAAACTREHRFESLLVSVPLNIRGAVGSPAQAVAIR